MFKRILLAVALLLVAAPAQAQNYLACQTSGSTTVCPGNVRLKTGFTLSSTYIGSGLDAAKIGGGTVTNTIWSYVDPTSSIQTQLNGKQATLTLPLSEANGGFGAAISGLGTGLLVRSAANTPLVRQLVAPAAGITVSNATGVAGNPTLALANDLAAIEALAGTGIAVRTAADTWAQRSVAASTGITVSNGDGVAGNPTIAIDATVATLSGSQILTNKTINCANNTCTVRLGSDVTGTLPSANLANTTVTAASYPTSGQIPTFTVNAQGQLTAAGSTTTLTSPAISSPTFSGTYDLAGTVSFAGDLTGDKGVNHNITVATTTAANGNGGNLALSAGTPNGTGTPGKITITAPNSLGSGSQGGQIAITAGDGFSSGFPEYGGSISIRGGRAENGNNQGGQVILVGGSADNSTGVGGTGLCGGGDGGVNSGSGGLGELFGGQGGATGGDGGDAYVFGGGARGGNGNGGPVHIYGGSLNGLGANGTIEIGLTNPNKVTIGNSGGTISLGQGTVTQITNATTSVTVNKSSAAVTTVSLSVAARGTTAFTVNNNTVTSTSIVSATVCGYTGTLATNGFPALYVSGVNAGSFILTVANVDATNALSGTVKACLNVL